MTIPSTSRKAGPLLGTGAQTAWPFTFKVFAASDIAVTIADSLGIETALVLDTDYSVTLNANQETSPGGTVTYPISGTPLAVGSKLSVIGDLDYDQPLDLPSGGNFSPLALENQLDRMTMQLQQLEERLSRALLVPVNSTADVQLLNPEANELIGWDSTGDNLANYALSELATGIAYGTMRFDTFVGDGTTTQFALTEDPAALANLDVSLAGVTQGPGTDYTLTSATLVFTTAPANGVAILARYGRALPIVGPTDSSAVTHVAAGAGAVPTTAQAKLRESVSVKDFGVVGVGDETAAIQAALTAATGKSLTFIPGVEYTISATLNVPAGTTIIGYGATLKNVTTHITLLSLATGCKVFGLKFIGAGGAYNASGLAIRAAGTRNGAGVAPTYLTDIAVQDCVITNCGGYGIELDYVARSFVTYNTIQNVGYSGVFCFSCDSVLVEGNYIDGLAGETVSGELNAYGIAFTSQTSPTDLVRDPQSQYCRAIGNLIRNIPTWHGLDTHGGTHCDFIDNRVENCRRGIILTNLTTVGASYCSVQGNTIINTLTGTNANGSQKQGEAIWDIGPSTSIRNFYNTISGNSIFQHGSPTELLACIYINNAEDGAVSANILTEPFTAGIGVYSDVRRYSVSNNTVVNPKGPGVAGGGSTDFPSGILFSGSNFTSITLSGNSVVKNNSGVAVKVGEIGVNVANTASKSIKAANNTFDAIAVDWYIPETTGITGEFSGSFTASLTGCTTVPTGAVRYSSASGVVTLSIDAAITGTSNTTALTLTGMPLGIAPSGNRYAINRVTDNSVTSFGVAIIASSGVISVFKDATLQALTATGTKGVPQQTITYLI